MVVNPWVERAGQHLAQDEGTGGARLPGLGRRGAPAPRPGNALGKVKIDMPNPHSIYLHDTPSKALFARESRAFSHGCIRVKDIDRLARELVSLDSQKPAEVESALAGSATRTLALQHERPVYLVYFTAEAGPDGQVRLLEDPYGRDAKLIASLDREVRMAANNRHAAAPAA